MFNLMRVLIVDDDMLDRQAARQALAATGLVGEIAEAERGDEALTRLVQETFDAVLLDFQLPDADGLSVLQEAQSRGISVPIIVLTGYGDERVAVELMRAGAADYLSKARLSAEGLGQSLRHITQMCALRAEAEQTEAEREQLLLTLSAEQGRTEAVLSSMTDGLVVSDLAGNVLTMNPAALSMHGYDSIDQARLPLSEFQETFELLSLEGAVIAPGDWPLARSLRGERFSHYEVLVRRKKTGRTWIGSYSGAPVCRATGEVILAIVTIRDITQAKQAEARAALLAEAGSRLSASLDAQTTLDTVAEIVVPDLADWCAVHALDPGGLVRPLLIAENRPGAGLQKPPLPPPLPLSSGAEYGIDFVLRTGTAQLIPALDAAVRQGTVQEGTIRVRLLGIEATSYLCVPLIVRGQIVGALSLASTGSRRVYDEQYLALAVELGRRVAAGLENARLFDEIRARAERESMLNKIGSALRVSLDSDQITTTVTEQVGLALGASRCCFLRFDPVRDALEAAPQQYLAPGVGAAAGASVLMDWPPDIVEGWSAGNSAVVSGSDPAWIGSPVFSRGLLGGILLAEQLDGGRVWSRDEAAFVSAVADILALALENARLYAREHRVADMLSSAFLTDIPDELPGLTLAANYRAGLEEAQVGGDYYDAFVLPDGRVALVIADVSGKGLSAAVQTATVKYSLRAFATEAGAPGLVVSRLNRMLCSDLAGLGDHFVTLFYAVFDPKTGRLSWASAGHESMLIKRQAGGSHLLHANGPILGLAEHAYVQETDTLAPGDSLVLYTDGLTEARDPETRLLLDIDGVQKLVESAPAEAGPGALAAFLQQAAMRWTSGRPQDDMALMVVRRQAQALPETAEAALLPALAWENEEDDLFQFQFPSRADYIGEVRQALGHWMATLGFDRADTEDFQTAVTEAVTNAVRHGSPNGPDGQFHVLGRRTSAGALHVEVTDSGVGLPLDAPMPLMPEPEALGGRGLPLMQELADTVEFRPAPRGLCVVLVKRRSN